MSQSVKLVAGAPFPKISVTALDGSELVLGNAAEPSTWQMVVVYRGKHCPLCTKFLNELESYRERLLAIGIDVVAVSGDSKEQFEEHSPKLNIGFPVGFGLSLAQMKELGVYISDPRSEQETDHPFAEPALLIVNEDGDLQVVDISNNPFSRPSLEALVGGLEWVRNPENNYPIRGMHAY